MDINLLFFENFETLDIFGPIEILSVAEKLKCNNRHSYTSSGRQESEESKIFKALDNLEAVIQHNEADISTWIPLEYDVQLTYGADKVTFSSYLTNLKKDIDKWTHKKISDSKKNKI